VNGGQDLGGQHGFGPVVPEADEPWFHAEWERRVFALTLAMGGTGAWSLDAARHARESIPPARYLDSSYFRIWIEGLQALMLARGLVTPEELADGRLRAPARPLPRVIAADAVAAMLARGGPTERPAAGPARFAVGDAVTTIVCNPLTHTRLPRYARGRPGTVVAVYGAHVYPDTNAHGQGEQPQWLYSVRFEARDLWGPDTTASSVFVDCWEPYLLPRSGAVAGG